MQFLYIVDYNVNVIPIASLHNILIIVTLGVPRMEYMKCEVSPSPLVSKALFVHSCVI